jgi:hypothetical protein
VWHQKNVTQHRNYFEQYQQNASLNSLQLYRERSLHEGKVGNLLEILGLGDDLGLDA